MSHQQKIMYFIGVSTSKSSVNKVFYDWTKIINQNSVTLKGVDIAVDSKSQIYHTIVHKIKSDEKVLGALVTSHKAKLFENTAGLFDKIEQTAIDLREIGMIYKLNGSLIGGASDPIAIPEILQNFSLKGWHKKHVLIMGSGGAGVALAYVLLTNKKFISHKIIMTEIDQQRVNLVKSILSEFDNDKRLEVFLTNNGINDEYVDLLPEESFIVNATGVGKDRPGSPITKDIVLPKKSFVWELNYRGDLQFLELAKSQQHEKNLRVEDGWTYFIQGWATVMSRVFHFSLDRKIISDFNSIATKLI